jgi:hypothetical protein
VATTRGQYADFRSYFKASQTLGSRLDSPCNWPFSPASLIEVARSAGKFQNPKKCNKYEILVNLALCSDFQNLPQKCSCSIYHEKAFRLVPF